MQNNNKHIVKILDLGFHPFADTFIKQTETNKSEPVYLLNCFLNKITGAIFLGKNTKAEDRYNHYDYSYTSSNSVYSRKYWNSYSKNIYEKNTVSQNTKILEIGSNDGYLLKYFKKKTKNVLGVDASSFMSKIARKNKINTYNLIFNEKTSNVLKKKISTQDIIIANNVVNHSDDVLDFLKGIKNLLSDNGMFIFEVPYWRNLVKNFQFDQIYHEHINYFTVRSADYFLRQVRLQIDDIIETHYHGGSIRFYVKHYSKEENNNNKLIRKYIKEEYSDGLFKKKTYDTISKKMKLQKNLFLKKLLDYKKKNYKIIGLGAPAKGNTFLNYVKIDNSIVDFVTDSSKFKKGKYTPLSRIPIKNDSYIKKVKKKILIFFLAWNLEKILKPKIMQYNNKIKFINFFQNLKKTRL